MRKFRVFDSTLYSVERSGRRCVRARSISWLIASALAACSVGAPRYQEARDALAHASVPRTEALEAEVPVPDAEILDRRALVEEVLRRNPSLESARQGWRAALARYPQETSLEDPMLGYGVAPWSLGSTTVRDGQTVELSQAIPFPGKLQLRGEVALAEAEAAACDYEGVRLRLATLASTVFDEYYLVTRAIAINAHHLVLLEDLERVALAQYEAGVVSQQDPLQAETERAMLEHRQVELQTQQRIAAERINALLHRRPDRPLPAPPATLEVALPSELELDALTQQAFADRPELRAAGARVEARESQVALARREFLPDFTVWAKYDAFWQERDLQKSIGFSIYVPLRLDRRRAALEQASAELARARSEQQRAEDQVRLSVVSAVERVREAHHLLALSRERLLPAARDRVAAARSAYATGQTSFVAVIDAERAVRDAELAQEDAIAQLSRRGAELDRAVGRLPVLSPGGKP